MSPINIFIVSWVVSMVCNIYWNVRLHRLPTNLKWSDLTTWDKVAFIGRVQFLVYVLFLLTNLL